MAPRGWHGNGGHSFHCRWCCQFSGFFMWHITLHPLNPFVRLSPYGSDSFHRERERERERERGGARPFMTAADPYVAIAASSLLGSRSSAAVDSAQQGDVFSLLGTPCSQVSNARWRRRQGQGQLRRRPTAIKTAPERLSSLSISAYM